MTEGWGKRGEISPWTMRQGRGEIEIDTSQNMEGRNGGGGEGERFCVGDRRVGGKEEGEGRGWRVEGVRE